MMHDTSTFHQLEDTLQAKGLKVGRVTLDATGYYEVALSDPESTYRSTFYGAGRTLVDAFNAAIAHHARCQ